MIGKPIVTHDSYSIPRMEEANGSPGSAHNFSTMYDSYVYWKFAWDEQNGNKTAFPLAWCIPICIEAIGTIVLPSHFQGIDRRQIIFGGMELCIYLHWKHYLLLEICLTMLNQASTGYGATAEYDIHVKLWCAPSSRRLSTIRAMSSAPDCWRLRKSKAIKTEITGFYHVYVCVIVLSFCSVSDNFCHMFCGAFEQKTPGWPAQVVLSAEYRRKVVSGWSQTNNGKLGKTRTLTCGSSLYHWH